MTCSQCGCTHYQIVQNDFPKSMDVACIHCGKPVTYYGLSIKNYREDHTDESGESVICENGNFKYVASSKEEE